MKLLGLQRLVYNDEDRGGLRTIDLISQAEVLRLTSIMIYLFVLLTIWTIKRSSFFVIHYVGFITAKHCSRIYSVKLVLAILILQHCMNWDYMVDCMWQHVIGLNVIPHLEIHQTILCTVLQYALRCFWLWRTVICALWCIALLFPLCTELTNTLQYSAMFIAAFDSVFHSTEMCTMYCNRLLICWCSAMDHCTVMYTLRLQYNCTALHCLTLCSALHDLTGTWESKIVAVTK